ncbi:MAG: hypothetical protein ACPGD8_03240 [Flavobacteriales bacterium]
MFELFQSPTSYLGIPFKRGNWQGACLIFSFLLCTTSITVAQDSTKTKKPKVKFSDIVSFNGYLKNLNIVSFSGNPLIGNSNEQFLHNRLNLRIYPAKGLTIGAELRTRFFYAGSTATTPAAKTAMDIDPGLIDMTWNIGNNSNPVHLNTTMDRLWIGWGNDKVDIRAGRQRINWGINTAWNPNDIFNAFSFVNFDYEERPGSDAVRFQYFGKNMSGFEIAVAPQQTWKQSTAAFMYKFNAKSYDFQFIAGQYRTDITAGFGFAGNAGNASLKGEIQWFGPYEGFVDSTHTVTASVSTEYSFRNALVIGGSLLFNSNGIDDANPAALATFFSGSALTAKNLMPTKYNAFFSLSYPATPLISISFSAMYGYGPNLLFLSPGFTYSIVENWDIMLTGQLFFSEFPELTDVGLSSKYQNVSNSVFLRLKWAF